MPFFGGVTAHAGTGSAADLRNPHRQHPFPCLPAFPGGDDDPGVWNGDPQDRDQFFKDVIAEGIGEVLGVDVICRTDPGDADGMGANALGGFQMFRVHELSHKVIAIGAETVENAAAHVIDPAVHGAVHGFRMPCVVVFRTGGMQPLVFLFIISFLEEDVSPDPGILQFSVVFHGGGGDVHIDPADRPVFMFDGVDRFDAFQHVLDGIVDRVFPHFQCQTLVTHVLKGDHFRADLLLRQFFTGDVLILIMIGTVQAAVDAIVGEVQRREHDDPVAVDLLFDPFCQGKDPFVFLRQFAVQQHQCLPVSQPFALLGFGDDAVDIFLILFLRFREGEGIQNFLMADEFFRFA